MPKEKKILWAVLAIPLAAVIVLIGTLLLGNPTANAKANLPDVRGKGLRWALTQAQSAGFSKIGSYDALGRDRHWREDRDWKVCFEVPPAGSVAQNHAIDLGVVLTTERCPSSDQARYDPAGATMPNLYNRTAFITTKILGDNASVRFLDRSSGQVTNSLGDWKVCSQFPQPGARFDGVPVTAQVVRFTEHC
jgi:hypothetical protein